jgi:hypothetical protein
MARYSLFAVQCSAATPSDWRSPAGAARSPPPRRVALKGDYRPRALVTRQEAMPTLSCALMRYEPTLTAETEFRLFVFQRYLTPLCQPAPVRCIAGPA